MTCNHKIFESMEELNDFIANKEKKPGYFKVINIQFFRLINLQDNIPFDEDCVEFHLFYETIQ